MIDAPYTKVTQKFSSIPGQLFPRLLKAGRTPEGPRVPPSREKTSAPIAPSLFSKARSTALISNLQTVHLMKTFSPALNFFSSFWKRQEERREAFFSSYYLTFARMKSSSSSGAHINVPSGSSTWYGATKPGGMKSSRYMCALMIP